MTNYEKYKKKIDKIWETDSSIAIINGVVKPCSKTQCQDCDWVKVGSCSVQTERWLVAEYKEPQIDWNNVPVDTPILVRDNEGDKWQRRYFAKCENGTVYAWSDGRTSWSTVLQYDFVPWEFAKLTE